MPDSQVAYLDYNATTPVDPRVLERMLPFFTKKFGNAASKNHRFGWESEEAVEDAREQVAKLIGAKPREIVFTSGATEANNLALKGILSPDRDQLVACVSEHKAVLDPMLELSRQGTSTKFLPIKDDGIVVLDELESSLTERTALVSIMLANNETGVIQPVKRIFDEAKKHGVLSMTDATQAVGKIPVHVDDLGVDLMSFSAHKMYGPKGVGGLYVRSSPSIQLKAQINGGGHERGKRSGTLNVPGIVGLGMACELCMNELESEGARLSSLRDELEKGLLEIRGTRLNGATKSRLPHVTNIAFEDLDGQQLILKLNDVAVSHGSACTSATVEPSHVLKAMGLSDELAGSSLRFSLGRFTTPEEIDFAIKRVKEVVSNLRS